MCRWARSGYVVLVSLCVLVAACGSSGSTSLGSEAPASRTVAFLRAVRSIQPENQAKFLEELAAAGYVAGENLRLIAADLDEVHPDAASSEAAVRSWADDDVDLIVALSTIGARAAAAAAPETPVLFLVNDPTSAGLVDDPRRPSGWSTGVTFRVPADRTLDVARRAFGTGKAVGLVYPPADPAAQAVLGAAAEAAAALDIDLRRGEFRDDEDARSAVLRLAAEGAQVIWVLNSPTSVRFIDDIAGAASEAGVPVISNTAVTSAVVILQPDTVELYRQIARQAIQLFDGRPVREIPVENPAGFVLEVNLAAARTLGVELPSAFVAGADRVSR